MVLPYCGQIEEKEATDKKAQEHLVLYKISQEQNFEFQEGNPDTDGVISGEYIDFIDIQIQTLSATQFIVINNTPRSFQFLTVLFGGYIGKTEEVLAFTSYVYSLTSAADTKDVFAGEKYDSLFFLGELPNPKFNIKINGFWSEKNGKFGFFTKRQKEQLTRTLVELRYIINHDDFKQALIKSLSGDEMLAESISSTFALATKVDRAFMLLKDAEGLASDDWFSIHLWRYHDDEAAPLSTKLIEVAAHEISHTLGYREHDAYPIGYTARNVLADYYKRGIIIKDKAILE